MVVMLQPPHIHTHTHTLCPFSPAFAHSYLGVSGPGLLNGVTVCARRQIATSTVVAFDVYRLVRELSCRAVISCGIPVERC